MKEILDNIKLLWPFLIFSWTVFLLSAYFRPYRFRNTFYLMLCCGSTLFFLTALFGNYMDYAFVAVFLLCMLAIFLVPVILIFNGLQMIKKEARSPGNLLSLLLGLFVGVGEIDFIIYVFRIGSIGSMREFGFLWFVFTTVLYFCILILGFVLYSLFMGVIPGKKQYDYVIIHGAGLLRGREVSKLLANRIDKAVEVYNSCSDKPILILSGGRGQDEDISEAQAMKSYLLSRGIPSEHLLLEERSKTTMENLLYSRILVEKTPGQKRVALVTSNYHVYRCICYAHSIGFKCRGIGAPVAWYFWPSALIREFVAVFRQIRYLLYMMLGYIVLVLLPVLYLYGK